MSKPTLTGVDKVVAVASGKGGVGKSTVTANLAAALSRQGKRVAILDADIYGPSQAMMFGIAAGTRPKIIGERLMAPIVSQGIQLTSMALLATDDTPMVWRGPMASGALQQLLFNTQWQDVDILLIDMPPGTGDIHLTLTQNVPLHGAVIVTTPQDIALIDARKGVEMFNKVSVPVLGLIENMAYHQCENCGHKDLIFGEGAGKELAQVTNAPLLAQIPLNRTVQEHADQGKPIAFDDDALASHYMNAAEQLIAELSGDTASAPTIGFSDD